VPDKNYDEPQLPRHDFEALVGRKRLLRDTVQLRGTVEQDGDYYIIDPDPCSDGPVVRVHKDHVRLVLDGDRRCPEGSVHQIYNVFIDRDVSVVTETLGTALDFVTAAAPEASATAFRERCVDYSPFHLSPGEEEYYTCKYVRKIVSSVRNGSIHIKAEQKGETVWQTSWGPGDHRKMFQWPEDMGYMSVTIRHRDGNPSGTMTIEVDN
jgi:hypothetical protein